MPVETLYAEPLVRRIFFVAASHWLDARAQKPNTP
jgi:hypothetical protein